MRWVTTTLFSGLGIITLKYCEAAFATRNISVVQAVYTRPNNPTLQRPFHPLPA